MLSQFAMTAFLFFLWIGSTHPAHAQQGPAWRLASEAGNLRLYRTALVAERPDGAIRSVAQLDRRLGFPASQGAQRYAFRPVFSLAPEVGYDRNFNGGLEADTIKIGGLDWSVTPETRARPSFYAGARLGAAQRVVWARGAAFSLGGTATYRKALDNDFDYRGLSLHACSENQIDYLTALDLCAQRSLIYRQHNTTRMSAATVGLSRIFVHDNALSMSKLTLGREFRPASRRNTIGFELIRLDRQHGLFSAQVFLGERDGGRSLTTFSTSLEHGRFIGDHFYRLGLRHARLTGGQFLGQRHHRREFGVTLALPSVFGLTPSIGYEVSKHDLSQFDTNHMTFSLTFRGYAF